MASASLGQVHQATLRNGRPVAVKVQRPGVRERVVEDMEVIEELADFVDRHTEVGRSFGFGGMVEEFRRSIMAELDYRIEAANLRAARRQPRRVRPHRRAAADRRLLDVARADHGPRRRPQRRLARAARAARRSTGALWPSQLFDCYLDQILVDGFFHADPHPGNVLLDRRRPSGARRSRHGRPASARSCRTCSIRLLVALSDGNGSEVATVMAGLGKERESWDPARFERAITASSSNTRPNGSASWRGAGSSASWPASPATAGCARRSS